MNRRQRILVVDDDSLNLSIMEEILGDHYELLMTTTGEECLKLARDFRPDLVLLDIMLPGIDGNETCRLLREDPRIRYIKVILVSAKSQLAERLEGYESQADDYITKPFDPEELMAKVRVMLRLQYMQELEEFKGDFLNLLAHETCTPLTGILTPAQLLQESDEVSPDTLQELSGMIVDSARSLHRLVQGTVELCAFKAGRALLEPRPMDLAAMVERLAAQCETEARAKSMTLEVDAPAETLVMVDEQRIEHVFRIVVGNAISHGQPGSCVQIRLHTGPEGVSLDVINEGEVISEGELPNVFEAFRVHDLDHYSKGVGVDLALAREIALAHWGDLECQPASPQAMLFSLKLPHCESERAVELVDSGSVETIHA